jgi:hypothetical protein
MRRSTLFLLALAAGLVTALVTARHAGGGERAGVTMPDTIQIGDKRLVLNGMGLREATFLKIDVYVAGLYLEQASSNPTEIITSNQTKRLVLRFVRDVDRDDIVKAWREGFAGNATVKLATIKPLIDRLNAWMVGFDDGDTLTFTYRPGEGLAVDVGTTRKGILKSDDFARSLFAIWLGPKPPTSALKRGLLGKH